MLKRLIVGFGLIALGLCLFWLFNTFVAQMPWLHDAFSANGLKAGLLGALPLGGVVCIILGLLAFINRLPSISEDWPFEK